MHSTKFVSALTKTFIMCVLLSLSTHSHARKELPFCPSGGPPGWMNYFDYKRAQNHYKNHHRQYHRPYPVAYYHPRNVAYRHYYQPDLYQPRRPASPPIRRPVHQPVQGGQMSYNRGSRMNQGMQPSTLTQRQRNYYRPMQQTKP